MATIDEAVFEELNGVVDAISGYAGGTAETANYEAVCSGRSGHAEVVKIIYNPATITYEELLRVHFATHDPTTLNRQGADKGTQYRSAIFYADDKERKFAEAFIETLTEEKMFSGAIVTADILRITWIRPPICFPIQLDLRPPPDKPSPVSHLRPASRSRIPTSADHLS